MVSIFQFISLMSCNCLLKFFTLETLNYVSVDASIVEDLRSKVSEIFDIISEFTGSETLLDKHKEVSLALSLILIGLNDLSKRHSRFSLNR